MSICREDFTEKYAAQIELVAAGLGAPFDSTVRMLVFRGLLSMADQDREVVAWVAKQGESPEVAP